MNVELATDLFLQIYLSQTHRTEKGAFIEIGLGNINYSFRWARKLGFKCYGVEPLVSANLRNLARLNDVDLTEAAVSTATGQSPIYMGSLNGQPLSDISSLNPEWWGVGTETRTVSTVSLGDYISAKAIKHVSCLKVDTEGSELLVISGLRALQRDQLPCSVVFEYGGGGIKKLRKGGWEPKFFENTVACLKVMKCLGYTQAMVIEKNARQLQCFELKAISNFDPLFPENAEVGNIICIRHEIPPVKLSECIGEVHKVLAWDRLKSWRNGGLSKIRYWFVRIASGVKRRLLWG